MHPVAISEQLALNEQDVTIESWSKTYKHSPLYTDHNLACLSVAVEQTISPTDGENCT